MTCQSYRMSILNFSPAYWKRKQTYQWYRCGGERTHYSTEQWWKMSLLNGDGGERSCCWVATTVFDPSTYSLLKAILRKKDRLGSRYNHKRRMVVGFSFFSMKTMSMLNKKMQKKIVEEDQRVKRERWRRMLGRRCKKGGERSISFYFFFFLQSRSFCFFHF